MFLVPSSMKDFTMWNALHWPGQRGSLKMTVMLTGQIEDRL